MLTTREFSIKIDPEGWKGGAGMIANDRAFGMAGEGHDAGKGRMLSISEYAKHTGYCVETVRRWAKKGLLEGAVVVPSNRCAEGYEHRIPMDASAPVLPHGRPRRKNGQKEPALSDAIPADECIITAKKRTRREIRAYIRKFAGTLSYARLSRDLGLTIDEIRSIYEELHRRYHV